MIYHCLLVIYLEHSVYVVEVKGQGWLLHNLGWRRTAGAAASPEALLGLVYIYFTWHIV